MNNFFKQNAVQFHGPIHIGDLHLSATGFLGSNQLLEPEPEALEIIISLLRDRLRSRRKMLISSVQDWREDQPTSFLQTGFSQSRSVCRIARYFPRKDFQIFIEDIKQLIQKLKSADNFNSIAKLKEIFFSKWILLVPTLQSMAHHFIRLQI